MAWLSEEVGGPLRAQGERERQAAHPCASEGGRRPKVVAMEWGGGGEHSVYHGLERGQAAQFVSSEQVARLVDGGQAAWVVGLEKERRGRWPHWCIKKVGS